MSTEHTTRLDHDLKLLAGLEKNQSTQPSFVLGGKTYTPADCAAFVQARVDAAHRTIVARAAALKTAEEERKEIAATQQLVSELKTSLLVAYSHAPDVLTDYGLRPRRKPGPQTVDAKAIAVAKRKATREARKTMGPRQKAAVKGSIPDTLTIPVPQPEPVAGS